MLFGFKIDFSKKSPTKFKAEINSRVSLGSFVFSIKKDGIILLSPVEFTK